MEDGVVNTEYKVATDMNKMIGNMTENMQKATLKGLKADGIMALDDDTLNTPVLSKILEGTLFEKDLTPELLAKGIDPDLYPTLGDMPTDKIVTYMGVLMAQLGPVVG
jgi:hypothetical protein